jgi:hypothetical protein
MLLIDIMMKILAVLFIRQFLTIIGNKHIY